MPNDSRNIAVGLPKAIGGVFRAPLGTVAPSARVTALATAFKSVGYISDAGVTRTIGETTTGIKAWGAGVVKKVKSEHEVVYKFTMIETLNEEALRTFHGTGNVAVVAATVSAGREITVQIKANSGSKGVFVLELADDPISGRTLIPNGEVTARGDVTFVDTATVSYPVEVTCYEDATGVKAYEWWTDGVFAAA